MALASLGRDSLPAASSLALFAWLLTLHEPASGRMYAAYGGVYIGAAIAWLWAVDGVRPSAWDLTGATVALVGMGIIADRSEPFDAWGRVSACLVNSRFGQSCDHSTIKFECLSSALPRLWAEHHI